ncbi:MAG TPA: hypothetical protein VEC15_10535 [Actinomycetota bacterium]|nr:hypothetical protein [Actinomycetota bacterium]
MGWFLLGGLAIMWVAFLLPSRRHPPGRSVPGSVEDFGRKMDLLADTGSSGSGRYIITPRKGMAFVGARDRAKERARDRRRRVFVLLLESIGLTGLIGLAPPLRVMWYLTAGLLVALGVYVWMLVSIKAHASDARERIRATAAPERVAAARQRYAADASSRTPRPAFNGLATVAADDLAAIVVKPARESYAGI